MKRKHSETNGDAGAASTDQDGSSSSPNDFKAMGLDPRLLQGIVKMQFAAPTLVQAKAVPLALEGKDVLARAKTGSGKTAAYLLPIIHGILGKKELDETPRIRALILLPSRELCDQVTKAIEGLTAFCSKHVRAVNIGQNITDKVQTAFLADSPEIVVATPARALKQLQLSDMALFKDLEYFVIDEADLVLSYGYEDDMKEIAQHLPKTVQSFMMSATLSEEVEGLKKTFCRNPVVLRLEEDEDEEGKLLQYCVRCAEDEKFLLTYVIFKLKLIRGKCIIFVGDIDRCYRLRLFLEQFGLKSCVLNSELPVNSRLHIVQEFNKDVYDIIIAADENEVIGDEEDEKPEKDEKEKKEGDAEGADSKPSKKKKRRPKKDKEFGVSRGIDFKNVSCVLNFDLPTSSKSYTHRIGRTARAGASGMALSFVIPKDKFGKHKNTTYALCEKDETVIEKITRTQKKKGHEVKPYVFDMTQVNAFRYRMEDALRAVTKGAVREARTRELRQELLHSEKLKRHFEENPEDLKHLRHDGDLRPARVQAHLKHVPEYLMPGGGAKAVGGAEGFVAFRKPVENRVRKARIAKGGNRGKGGKRVGGGGRARDPLKTFKSSLKK